jgi:glycosyltransferase involved in cell wall biosynthesis
VAADRAPERLAGGEALSTARPRVLLVRGHQANSWHLRPWRHLSDRFDVTVLRTRRNWFDTESLGVKTREARALRDLLPPGRLGHTLARVPGDRYLSPREAFEGADIVHSQDLGFWYSMQAAKYREELGYRLVLTVWETIPFLDAYRNVRTRPYRRRVLGGTDLFLATTERARAALLLEGAPADRVEVVPPGVDDELFRSAAPPAAPPSEHLIVSAGRLVWEKGHQDLLRAVAALRRRVVPDVDAGTPLPRILIAGAGPEEARLRRYADELGIADRVELREELVRGGQLGASRGPELQPRPGGSRRACEHPRRRREPGHRAELRHRLRRRRVHDRAPRGPRLPLRRRRIGQAVRGRRILLLQLRS